MEKAKKIYIVFGILFVLVFISSTFELESITYKITDLFTETDGEKLQEAGYIKGDENGNLLEEFSMNHAELAVIIAEIHGEKELAKKYYPQEINQIFKDVKGDDWFAPYTTYAHNRGWAVADEEGYFNPTKGVSDDYLADVVLRVLGYEVKEGTNISSLRELGISIEAEDYEQMTRGEVFSVLWQLVNTPPKNSDVLIGEHLKNVLED